MTTLARGTQVGDYEVVRFVGQGGMGVVHAVRAVRGPQSPSPLALKTPRMPWSAQQRRLLQREGHLQAQLGPEAVVPVHQILHLDGVPGLIMPLADGSLADVLAEACVSTSAAVAVLIQVLRALRVTHQAGIVHADVKPANLLVDLHEEHVRIRLADFGVAVCEGVAPPPSRGLTPRYGAPEQQAGDRPRPAWDYWSLGVLALDLAGWPVAPGWRELIDGLLEPDPARRLTDPDRVETLLRAITHPDPLDRHSEWGRSIARERDSRRAGGGEPGRPPVAQTLTAHHLHGYVIPCR